MSLFMQFTTERSREAKIPLSGTLELTPQCTLDCKMCYVHLTKEQMGLKTELSIEQWIRIIDEACEEGMLFALITGGECLLHKGFKDIYLHLKEKNVFTSLNTNGTLLTDEYIDFFKANPPTKINISLYGITEDGYERVTGRRLCERVKTNILKVKAAGLNLKVAISVSKYLLPELFDIIEFCRGNHIPYQVDMTMHKAEDSTGRDIQDYVMSPEEIVENLILMRKRYSDKPFYQNSPIDVPPYDDSGRTEKKLSCGAGRNCFTVKWDGRFQPCLMSESSVDILQMPFKEAWKEICKMSEDTIIPVECVSCKLRKICHSCAYTRMDPYDFGHRDPNVCKTTVLKYRAGLIRLENEIL